MGSQVNMQRATGSDSVPTLGTRCSNTASRSLPAPSLSQGQGLFEGRFASPSPMPARSAADLESMFRSHSNMTLRGPRRTSPPARRAGGDDQGLLSMVPEPEEGIASNV